MKAIAQNTLDALLEKHLKEISKKLYFTRLGKITKQNEDGSFAVRLLEKIQYQNQEITPFISSCFIPQYQSKTNGFVLNIMLEIL